MKKNSLFMFAALSLAANFAHGYTCTVDRYESDSSQIKTTIVGPVAIPLAGEIPSEGGAPISTDQAAWYVTRNDGMVSVELRDTSNQTIAISATEEGADIRVKAPQIKQVLNCNCLSALCRRTKSEFQTLV